MLLTQQITAVNLVSAGSMSVDVDALESAYIKAYGEPTIDLGGSIAYVPLATGPDVLAFDTALDIGTGISGGQATPVPGYGIGGFDVVGRGGMPAGLFSVGGFFNGRQNVTTDFTLEGRVLLGIPGATLTPPAPAQGLVQGVALFEALATDAPAIFFGLIQPTGGARELSVHQRTTTAGALVRMWGVSLPSYAGILLKIVRTASIFTFTYSIDGGVTWVAAPANVGATASSYAAGLFVNNGSNTLLDSLNRVLVDKVILRKGNLGYFTIINSGSALMRSQSPHQLSLDGKVDPEAENKVKGWLSTIRDRLVVAKTTLMANDNPVNEASTGTVTEQV